MERISDVALTSGTAEDKWELIQVAKDILGARKFPAVVPLNDTEFVIMGGYSYYYQSCVVIFDTTTGECQRVVDKGEVKNGFVANANQAALVGENRIVALVMNSKSKPSLIEWNKGADRITVLKEY